MQLQSRQKDSLVGLRPPGAVDWGKINQYQKLQNWSGSSTESRKLIKVEPSSVVGQDRSAKYEKCAQ